jgi:holo-[acyl-carrier protein] synthase
MIFGIGVDLVQISRVQKGLDRFGDRLGKKILSAAEFEEFKEANEPARFLAKRFAAKEAFSKALGTGFSGGVTLGQIEVGHNSIGRPILKLSGRANDALGQFNIRHSHVSISDEKTHVIAFVTLECRIRHNH